MKTLYGFSLFMVVTSAHSHQPVMDMAPRWSEGYGIQLRQEHYGSNELRRGSDKTPNTIGLKRFVDTTWAEGVYTFDRSIRATVKIPYINQKRVTSLNGSTERHQRSGVGDIVLGLPLKHYKNEGATTQNWGLTPSVRIPTGTSSGEFPISDGSWDVGLSVSYSWENPLIYQLYDLYYWHQGPGQNGMQSGDSWGIDVNVGLHPWHDNDKNVGIFTLWDISAHHENKPNSLNRTTASGGERVHTGPVFIYYRNSLMVRTEYKYLAHEHVDGISSSRGNEFSVALGYAF